MEILQHLLLSYMHQQILEKMKLKTEFYDELRRAIESKPCQNVLIIIGYYKQKITTYHCYRHGLRIRYFISK